MIGVDEHVCGGEEVAVGVEDADGDGVLAAVAEESGEGREIDAIGFEVESLDAGDGLPQIRVEAAGEDPGIDRRDACGLAVDGDFGLAEGGVAAALEFACYVVGDAEVPELIADLALRDDVEVDLLDVAWEVERSGGLVGGGVERDGAVAGAYGNDDVGYDGRRRLPGGWVELELRRWRR